jgi:hypothetical protein
MTTAVTVQAHCPASIEVVVSVTGQPDIVLQDTETTVVYVYGDRTVSVKEVAKVARGE